MSGDMVPLLRNAARWANDAADEIERLESQVQMLAGLSRRMLLAGDALAEVADEWPELVEAWQEARRD
jgi:hypothetical protein